jgi:LAO/AO transport system kinase
MTHSITTLLDRFKSGDPRALARLITCLDNAPDAHKLLEELGPAAKRAGVIGVTGAPGVGKSTLLSRLIGAFRARGKRVAVLAVDPQSPISGGALLGDRIRMADAAAGDADVFIRSLSSRGVAGGLSASVRWICRLLERFGYDIVLVETVGVGQAELGVLRVADVVVLMVMPGTGDAVQWEKAGLIEVAHLVVINKADHPGVERLEQELRDALNPPSGQIASAVGLPGSPILRTIASENVGIDAVVDELLSTLAAHPRVDWHQARTEILQEAEMLIGQRLGELAEDGELIDLSRAVATGDVELSAAAETILRRLLPRVQ